MYDLIVAPFLGDSYVLRPGSAKGMQIPAHRYLELQQAVTDGGEVPSWLCGPVQRQWSLDLTGSRAESTLLVRDPSPYGHGRASYELNLGCNYACKQCYLGLKEFAGLDWSDREKVLHVLRDAGVVWLQITGGEPTIDRHFAAAYSLAYELGMMIEVLTNGSRLHNPLLLDLFASRRPYRLTLSIYGATEETYDGLTQRRGSWKNFTRGLNAAHEAGLPIELTVIVTDDNVHEVEAMHALGERYGAVTREYSQMSPTIYGGAESLSSQATAYLRERKPFTGCDAGHTSLHVDPHGLASVCKVSRDHPISLVTEGVAGLSRLGDIADRALGRQGGCAGCTLSKSCSTCMPLAALYRKAGAPLNRYCQHTETEGRR
ncbi:radical SAM protein [Streptomyces regalis]|uniref:Radical SAM protein n=1 Tax=Streptomyces regalis TaxID=68262 RepID=A0A101JH44_9ACTN|nr:radical SAM protein [Streptomyces regalis]KUL26654.1 radical SAM protein [Streptomyces regalis]